MITIIGSSRSLIGIVVPFVLKNVTETLRETLIVTSERPFPPVGAKGTITV